MAVPKADAHHHLWDADLHGYPGLSRPNAPVARRYLLNDFPTDPASQSLRKSVHVQGQIARNLSVTETEWLQGIADRHGSPHAIVACAPLEDSALDAFLEAHARFPNQCDRADLLTDPAWRAHYGLSFDLQALPEQMADAAALAAANPECP